MGEDAQAVADTPHKLLPFLQHQSQGALTRLYSRPSACLSVFRLSSCVVAIYEESILLVFALKITRASRATTCHESSLVGISDSLSDNVGLGDTAGQEVNYIDLNFNIMLLKLEILC